MRLWRNSRFARFFIGASLSIVGDWFNTVAITVLAYRITGRVSLVAGMIAASVLPRVLLGPLGGVLADRFERRRLLIALDGVRAVVALLPLFARDSGSLWVIFVAVVLLQAGSCLYNPAQSAYVPHVVPDDLLESANAAYAGMRDIGMFGGPALAAVALGWWGPPAAFWANSLSFVVAAVLLLSLPRATNQIARVGQVRDFVGGLVGIVRRYPRIGGLYLSYLATSLLIYFFLATMVVYARNLGQPTAFIGVLYAAAGLGGALGALVAGSHLRRLPYGVVIPVYVLSVVLLGVMAFVHTAGLALALFACSTAAGTVGDLLFTVYVQRYVAPDERGRAFGLLFWSIAIGQLLGAMLGITASASTAVPGLAWISLAVFPFVLAGVLLSMRSQQPTGAHPTGVATAEGSTMVDGMSIAN